MCCDVSFWVLQWAPPRKAHYVTEEDPGSEVAGEMAAALAATSIAFQEVNATYAAELLQVGADMRVTRNATHAPVRIEALNRSSC